MIGVVAGLARWRWLLPIACGIGLWWALIVDPVGVQGRSLNAAIQGAHAVVFLAPVVGLAGALAGLSIRENRSRIRTGATPLAIVVGAVAVAHGLIGFLALAFSALAIGVRAGASGLPGLAPIALGALTVTATSAVAQFLGRVLPPTVAAPLALLGSFVVLAFPRSFSDPLWLRHLVHVEACCGSPEQIEPRVLAAMATVSLGVLTAALLTAVRFHRLVLSAGVCVILVLAGTTGVALVRDLDWSAATARTGNVVCLDVGVGDVCVWPENATALPQLARIWADLYATADQHGLDVSPNVSERAQGPVIYGDGLMSITPATPPASYPTVLVMGALPPFENCIVDGVLDSDIDNAWLTLARWWIDASGYTVPEQFVVPPYEDYLDVPPQDLDQRLTVLLEATRTCDTTALP